MWADGMHPAKNGFCSTTLARASPETGGRVPAMDELGALLFSLSTGAILSRLDWVWTGASSRRCSTRLFSGFREHQKRLSGQGWTGESASVRFVHSKVLF